MDCLLRWWQSTGADYDWSLKDSHQRSGLALACISKNAELVLYLLKVVPDSFVWDEMEIQRLLSYTICYSTDSECENQVISLLSYPAVQTALNIRYWNVDCVTQLVRVRQRILEDSWDTESKYALGLEPRMKCVLGAIKYGFGRVLQIFHEMNRRGIGAITFLYMHCVLEYPDVCQEIREIAQEFKRDSQWNQVKHLILAYYSANTILAKAEARKLVDDKSILCFPLCVFRTIIEFYRMPFDADAVAHAMTIPFCCRNQKTKCYSCWFSSANKNWHY